MQQTTLNVITSAPWVDFPTTVRQLAAVAPDAARVGGSLRGKYQALRKGQMLIIERKEFATDQKAAINVEKPLDTTIYDNTGLHLIVLAMAILHQRSFHVESHVERAFQLEAFDLARKVDPKVSFPAHWFGGAALPPEALEPIEAPEWLDFRG